MNILVNFLNEMAGTPREVYHYTNTSNLSGILKDGYIETSDFEANTKTENRVFHGDTERDRTSSELATVRPSMSRKVDLTKLSSNIGMVKFIIKPHILSDKVRGVKIKPIAEFPLYAMKEIAEIMQQETGADPKTANEYAKKIFKKGRDYKDAESFRGFIIWLKKNFPWKKWENVPTTKIGDRVDEYLDYAVDREGEERISIAKNNKIPLDSRYLKIELMNGFTKDFEEGYLKQTQYEGQKTLEIAQWKRRLEQWNSIFEKNNEYYKFSNFLTRKRNEITKKVNPTKFSKKPVSITKIKKEQMKRAITQGARFQKGSKIEKPIVMPSYKDLTKNT